VASCRVSASGEFASFQGDTYYYAFYCVEEQSFPDAGSCNDERSLNNQHADSNVAVFQQRGSNRTVRMVVSLFTGFAGHSRTPRIVECSQGTVMELPFWTAASCECNNSPYYLWRPQTRDWSLMDWESWQREVARKLPPELTSENGYWPDLRTLTTTGALWRREDAHCCPTGGSVSVQLGIVGNRFVLKSLDIKVNRPEPQR